MSPARLVSQEQPRTADVRELPQASERWALLVGVEDYTDQNISPLRGPANDVNKVREALVKYAAFPEDNIIVLSTASHDGGMPTKNGILVALSKIKNSVPDNGLLLFMFSGHGMSRGGRAFLLPSNATLTDDADLLEDTSLSVDLLRRRIAATNVKQVIVFLDACRNDPERSKAASDDNPLSAPFTSALDFARLNKEVEASAVIYATGLGERAYIDTNEGLGYLAEGITKGLVVPAADGSRQVTLGNLVTYIQMNVPKWVIRDLNKEQKPSVVIAGFQPEQLVVSAMPMPPLSTIAAPTAASVIRKPPPSTIPDPTVVSYLPATATLVPSTVSALAETTVPLEGILDFDDLYQRHKYDAIELVTLGEAAFVRGNYTKTTLFFDYARAMSGDLLSTVGMYNYPYHAAAVLLSGTFLLPPDSPIPHFSNELKEMARRMRLLGDLQTVSKAITQLTVVRHAVGGEAVKAVDEVMGDLLDMKASFSAASPTTRARTACYFSGSPEGDGTTFFRKYDCVIPDVAHLDRGYQQVGLVDASHHYSDRPYAHVPPGIEIKVSGYLKWLVDDPQLVSDRFSIKNSCENRNYYDQATGFSCSVMSEIIAHYRY